MSLSRAPAAPPITRDPRRIRVLFGGHEIGQSANVLVVREPGEPPTLYFPPADVEMAVLTRTVRETPDATKGLATWFTLYRDAHVVEHAAWSFEVPSPPYQAIARRVAFQTPHFEFAAHGGSPADWTISPDAPSATGARIDFAGVAELASALRRAAAAHHEHQSRLSAADPDWPTWYAAFIASELPTPASSDHA